MRSHVRYRRPKHFQDIGRSVVTRIALVPAEGPSIPSGTKGFVEHAQRHRGEMLYSLVLTTVDQGLVPAWARLRSFVFASPPTTGHEIDIRLLREYLAEHYYKGYERGDDWLAELHWRKLRADDPDVISAINDAVNARKDSSR